MAPLLELEGIWDEILAHAGELTGRRVRVTVLLAETGTAEARSRTK